MKDSSSALSCKGLACGYGTAPVLQDVDLEFAPGTTTAIIGPNGSGKSTLLKTLSGELKPFHGSVFLGSRSLLDLSILDTAQRIAVVPQSEQIAYRFTAGEIVLMGRLPMSPGIRDTSEDRDAAEKAMRFTDSWELRDRPINELSGGERQRVLVARALAQDTPVILLDEPTTHLDITHQLDLVRLVKELQNLGKTVVAAMHDLNLVGAMAQRTALLWGGQVSLQGLTEQILTSSELDEAYGVAFRRVLDGGKTLVLPPIN
ncbi:MAG TPA: ABC transporter ATP-binding protein [Fimbriimonadaceae bacterium]|nr:ABC transporter ATP-binding protein [Fimbriimonadaceae bacterium]